ncbi:MAG: tetratricopeptide repeat protein, partial [Bacteroidetes bacterium]|nr:tetratricopeptide repeat protein [Bacteroidota bacterium]
MSDLVENILKEIENKNYGLAIELCDKLISQQPNNENIYELKAGCLAALKDYKKAAECYGNAVDTAVMNKIPAADISVLHYKKGKTHLKLSEIENAAREFKAALDYNPDSDKANNDYSACLRKLDLCEEALEFANKAVMLSPNSAEYYNNRGNIYYCLGKTDESVRDYNKAIELNPGYANAYFNRGSIYFESVNDTERARQDWLRAIELNPEYRNELTQHSEAVRKLIEEKPIEDKPIEKPVEDKPVEDKPVEDKPV